MARARGRVLASRSPPRASSFRARASSCLPLPCSHRASQLVLRLPHCASALPSSPHGIQRPPSCSRHSNNESPCSRSGRRKNLAVYRRPADAPALCRTPRGRGLACVGTHQSPIFTVHTLCASIIVHAFMLTTHHHDVIARSQMPVEQLPYRATKATSRRRYISVRNRGMEPVRTYYNSKAARSLE